MFESRFLRFITQPIALLAYGCVCGMGLYYALPTEPNLAALWLLSIFAIGFTVFSYLYYGERKGVLFIFLAALMCSFLYAKGHTNYFLTATDINYLDGKRLWVSGQITAIDPNRPYARVTLENPTFYQITQSPKVKELSITTHLSRLDSISVGQYLSAQVQLSASNAPIHPYQTDWRLINASQGSGIRGFVMGELYRTSGEKPLSWLHKVRKVRESIVTRIYTKESGQAGAVAAALLTGIRSGISEDIYTAYRESGLAHLMAISGMHLAMLALAVFLGVRLFLCFNQRWALTYDIRILAAWLGLGAAFVYVLLAGATVPTLRAFIMVLAFMLAVILGRISVGLRAICIACVGLLIWRPSLVAGPSFQLSFAASFALILWAAWHKLGADKMTQELNQNSWLSKIIKASIVAGLATMPFAAFHFEQISLSGFIANIIGIPLLGFVILPAGFTTLVLMLFNLEHITKPILYTSTQILNAVATETASWPWSSWIIPPHTTWLLACITVVMLFAFISSRRLIFSLGGISLFLCVWLSQHWYPFDMLITDYGKTVIARSETGYQTFEPATAKSISYITDDLNRYKVPAKNICDSFACISGGVTVMINSAVPSSDDCRLSLEVFGAFDGFCYVQKPSKHESFIIKNGRLKVFKPAQSRPWQ